jgi:hypothetical protein
MKKISRRALFGLLIPAALPQIWPPAPPASPASPETPGEMIELGQRVTLIEAAVTGHRVRIEVLEECYSYCGVIPEIEGKV